MDMDFSNSVRILAVADEQSIVQFCEESGTIDRVLGFKDSYDTGDSVAFMRFKNLSSVYDLKRRSKNAKLGGRSVLVETIADSPTLQGQCRKVSQPSNIPTHSTPYHTSRMKTSSEKENHRRCSSNRPMSAPSGQLLPVDAWCLENGNDTFRHLRPNIPGRLYLRQMAAPRSLSYRVASRDDSTITMIGGLPSPLARSPTVLRDRIRSNSLRASRASTVSPQILRAPSATSQQTRSILVNRALSVSRKPLSPALNNFDLPQRKYSKLSSSFSSDIYLIKKELVEAKENYALSLEKVKNQLALMEMKYGGRHALEEPTKTRRTGNRLSIL